jgi:hypothetical protein
VLVSANYGLNVLSVNVLLNRGVKEERRKLESELLHHDRQKVIRRRSLRVVVYEVYRAERIHKLLQFIKELCPRVKKRKKKLRCSELSASRRASARIRISYLATFCFKTIKRLSFKEVGRRNR